MTTRTLYRDIEALRSWGVPVEGKPGAGYWLEATVSLPPVDLTLAEWQALELAIQVLGDASEETLRQAAISLSAKLAPGNTTNFAEHNGDVPEAVHAHRHLPTLRAAIASRQKLRVMTDADAVAEIVRPLDLAYRGRSWLLLGWSETAEGFREIRIAALEEVATLPELFLDEPGKGLSDYPFG